MEPRTDEPKNTLSRAGYRDNIKTSLGGIGYKTGTERTLSVNPQEATFRFPFLVNVSLEEPGCSFLVIGATRDVMVSRRIRWGEPFVDGIAQLVFWYDA
jgi:hypothetical protein